jgi:hypothetical protein
VYCMICLCCDHCVYLIFTVISLVFARMVWKEKVERIKLFPMNIPKQRKIKMIRSRLHSRLSLKWVLERIHQLLHSPLNSHVIHTSLVRTVIKSSICGQCRKCWWRPVFSQWLSRNSSSVSKINV